MRHIFYPSLDACLPIVNIEACIIRFVISQSTGVTQNNSQALQDCVTKNIRRIIYFPLKLIQTCSTPPSVTLRVRSDKPKETLQFFSRSWLTKQANERSVEMLVKELKWYSLFVFFVGVILGFTDHITDILTLAEFYCANHNSKHGLVWGLLLFHCHVLCFKYCSSGCVPN